MDKKWPIPEEEAASIIISELPEKDKKTIANTPKGLLIAFHFGLGMYIRNKFQMGSYWRELYENDYRKLDEKRKQQGRRPGIYPGPDSWSSVVIEAVWEELQKDTTLWDFLKDPDTGEALPEEWRNLDFFEIYKIKREKRRKDIKNTKPTSEVLDSSQSIKQRIRLPFPGMNLDASELKAHMENEDECRWCFAVDMSRIKGNLIATYNFPDATVLHFSCPRCGGEFSYYIQAFGEDDLRGIILKLKPGLTNEEIEGLLPDIKDRMWPEYDTRV
jgi:hypothetical protein